MELDLNNGLLQSGNSLSENQEHISLLTDVVKSLMGAASTLQTMKDSETNYLFRNIELNFPKEGIDFYKAKKSYELNLIKQALRQTQGNQSKAAKLLKMNLTTLNSFIKRHELDIEIRSIRMRE